MEFLIISGLSGAGKSQAADILEDLDYYCVDNMPAALLPKFAEFCMATGGRYERVALVVDIRDRGGFTDITESLHELLSLGCEYRILFMESDSDTILHRYKETRRPHPLQSEAGSLEAAITLERARLNPLRSASDFVINTSTMTIGMLQSEIYRIFVGAPGERPLFVNVMSFGFKYGIPAGADMLLDVRFLPNPFYVAELRPKNGTDKEVFDFVHSHDAARQFMEKIKDLIEFLIPQYIEEGKHSLTIAIGCTGGHHRSVAIAEALSAYVKTLGQASECIHRDIRK